MLTLQCERSGVYKPPKRRKKLNLEGTCSRKCDCPFRLRGYSASSLRMGAKQLRLGTRSH